MEPDNTTVSSRMNGVPLAIPTSLAIPASPLEIPQRWHTNDHTTSQLRIDLIPAQKWWTPPVAYNSDVLHVNRYAENLLYHVDDIVNRIRELRRHIEAELSARFHESNEAMDHTARRAAAKQIVTELYEVYLYLKMHYARLENNQYTEILCLIVHICENHGLDEGGFVEYAIGEYVMFTQSVKDFFYFLNPVASYMSEFNIIYHTFRNRRHLPQAEVISFNQLATLEFILKRANNLRFEVSCVVHFPAEEPSDSADASAASTSSMPTVARHFRIETPFVDLPSRENYIGMVTPLAQACMYAEHDAVLLLLRYGAMPTHLFASRNAYRQQREQPIHILVNNLNSRVDMLIQQRPVANTDLFASDSFDVIGNAFRLANRFICCLQYMLRADPYLSISYNGIYNPANGHVQVMNSDTTIIGAERAMASLETLTLPGTSSSASEVMHTNTRPSIIIDSRVKERFLPSCLTEDVPSLMRACRYVIRRVLRRKQLLPEGIKCLPLPSMMKTYIDLLQD